MKTALLVIDAQTSLIDEGPWNAFAVLERIIHLVGVARAAGALVVFVRDRRVEPDRSIHPRLAPREGEIVIDKGSCDSFFETPLRAQLTAGSVTRLVVAGLQTDYCVDTTCRRAVTMGLDVVLAADAHTTFHHEHLQAEQIVAHHNRILRGLTAGKHCVSVVASNHIEFF